MKFKIDLKFKIKNLKFSKVKAFTMLELLIVIGITATLSIVGIGFYVNQQKAKILENTAQEIANYLHYAQQKSMAQEQGLQWGVHFENPSSGSDFYGLYSGSSYATTTETKYLPAGIEFQTPASGASIDISYAKLTGFLSGSSYQQIILINSAGLMKNVLTCQQGIITYNADLSTCGGIDTSAPTVSNVTASNTSYGSYVDTPFDLTANINDDQGGVTSCEYTINGGTNWYSANVAGVGPSYTCTKTGITSSDGASLTLNMRATSQGGTGTGSSIARTVDAVAPTCSDNWTDNWTATSPVNITITSNDARSGVASTKYCVDTANTCSPSTSYTTSVAVTCASGSTCTQYLRYASWDNVNNASAIYSKRVRQDLQAPANGTLNATPSSQQVSLSWYGISDSGSGLATSNTYKLVYSTSSSPAATCTSGTQIYLGTSTSYLHSSLTNGTLYYYRLCAYDALNNVSNGATASATPTSCTCGSWSSCSDYYSSTCDESYSGTQTRTCTPSGCDYESQSCSGSRETDGISCGTTTYGTCGSCSYGSTCACTGTGTQSVTTYTCSGGTCGSNTSYQSCTCTRSTDGVQCTDTVWTGVCDGCVFDDVCDTSGSGEEMGSYTICSGCGCGGTTHWIERSCTCTRSTNGTVCSTGTCGCSTSCSYSSTCANTGTCGDCWRPDTLCLNGSCSDVHYYYCTGCESSCNRDTTGIQCSTNPVLYCCSGYCNCGP